MLTTSDKMSMLLAATGAHPNQKEGADVETIETYTGYLTVVYD
jgi:hypothetical protein